MARPKTLPADPARVRLELSQEERRLLRQAAGLLDLSMAAFARRAVAEAARRTIAEAK